MSDLLNGGHDEALEPVDTRLSVGVDLLPEPVAEHHLLDGKEAVSDRLDSFLPISDLPHGDLDVIAMDF